MLSKKSFGIAGAAMLGTVALLGTNAANAAIDLDADDKSATITYAKETLLKTNAGTVEGEVDGKTYYVVSDTGADGSDDLNVTGMVGVGGPAGSTVIIEFVFDNMVLTDTAPTLSIAGFQRRANDVVHRAGGEEGEDTISFIATRDQRQPKRGAVGNFGYRGDRLVARWCRVGHHECE